MFCYLSKFLFLASEKCYLLFCLLSLKPDLKKVISFVYVIDEDQLAWQTSYFCS